MRHSNTGDDIFINAAPATVFRLIESLPRNGAAWPGARMTLRGDLVRASLPSFRRSAGVRMAFRIERVRPGEGLVWNISRGEVRGRGEWWLEPFKAGTVVHYLLDVEAGTRGHFRRWSSRVRRHRWAIRRGMNALKERLERSGAPAGV